MPRSRLNSADVIEIVRLYSVGEKLETIKERFNVSIKHIYTLARKLNAVRDLTNSKRKSRITPEMRAQILLEAQNRISSVVIARQLTEQYNVTVTRAQVSVILSEERRKGNSIPYAGKGFQRCCPAYRRSL